MKRAGLGLFLVERLVLLFVTAIGLVVAWRRVREGGDR
jgi:hypothetical protein